MRRKVWIIVLVVLLAAGYVGRVVYLNLMLPAPKLEQCAIGEAGLTTNSREITVENSYFMDDESFQDLCESNNMTSPYDQRCLVVEMTVKNVGTKDYSPIPIYISVVSGMFSINMSMELLTIFNDIENLPMAISPSESAKIIFPFVISSATFTSRQWENLKSSDFDLLLSLYPTKRVVNLI